MKQRMRSLIVITLMFTFICTGVNINANQNKELSLLFTHDLHSHLESFKLDVDGEISTVGGFTRIKSIMDDMRKKDPNTLFVDAGDFSMGTLYQTIYEKEAAELKIMGRMGFEVTTLGNHELDYRDQAFGNMLVNAKESSNMMLPQFVLANFDWSQANEETLVVKDAMDEYGVKPYVMLNKGNVKVAVFGIYGKQSLDYSPMTELKFKDPIESAKETIQEIKEKEDADIIICLSHSGTSDNLKNSEDEQLAMAVSEIDVIVSGHTHTTLIEPIIHGNTAVVSSGEYGIRVGTMHLSQNNEGRWDIDSYKLLDVEESLQEDAEIKSTIEQFSILIQSAYLEQFQFDYHEVIARNPYNFTSINSIGKEHREYTIGNLLSDSYVYTINDLFKESGKKIDVAVVPNGIIRESFYEGDIRTEDIFNILSLGVGDDGIPGYPLLEVYLSGSELKTLVEIDASISPIMGEARLHLSGLHFTFNPNRMLLNKVTDVYLWDEENGRTEIENDTFYRVVADLYSSQMLSAVTDKSFGLLSIIPKDENGNEIVRMEDHIIYDGDMELKAWVAVANYLSSFEQVDGVSQIPSQYQTVENRKVVDDASDLISRFKNPNKFAFMLYGIILVILLLLITIVYFIYKKVRKVIKKKKLQEVTSNQ